jgi:hypothetical protein
MLLALIVGAAFTLVGIGVLASALRKYRLRRRILDMPTESPGSISLGLSELTGHAQPASEILTAPLEDRPSLIYHYALFEEVKSDDGKAWVTHEAGTHGVPFLLEGEQGRVLVDPTDAEIHLPTASKRHRFEPERASSVYWNEEDGTLPEVETFMSRCDDLAAYRVDPLRSFSIHKTIESMSAGGGTGRWAFRRECLYPGDDAYVLGQAHPPTDTRGAPDDVTAVVRAADESSLWSKAYDSVYVISNQSEKDFLADRLSMARWQLIIGLLSFGAGVFALYFPLQFYT